MSFGTPRILDQPYGGMLSTRNKNIVLEINKAPKSGSKHIFPANKPKH